MWVDDKEPPQAEKECRPSSSPGGPPHDADGRPVRPRLRPGRGCLGAGAVPVPRGPGPPPGCSDAEVLTVAVAATCSGAPASGASWPRCAATGALLPRAARAERVQPARALAVGRLRAAPPGGAAGGASGPLAAGRHDGAAGEAPQPGAGAGRVGRSGRAAGRLGLDAAHREWFFGFRLGLRTDLGARVVRTWGLVPAAVDERAVADALLDGAAPAGLLLDRGFLGRAWAAAHRARGTRVVHTPGRAERGRCPGRATARGPAQPDRDDHRRADRGPGPGAPPREDRVGPAHPGRRHDPGPHPPPARPRVTDESTSRASGRCHRTPWAPGEQERPGTAPLRACADGGQVRSAPYGRGYGAVRSRPLHSPQRAGDSRMTRALRGKQKASAAQQAGCAK